MARRSPDGTLITPSCFPKSAGERPDCSSSIQPALDRAEAPARLSLNELTGTDPAYPRTIQDIGQAV